MRKLTVCFAFLLLVAVLVILPSCHGGATQAETHEVSGTEAVTPEPDTDPTTTVPEEETNMTTETDRPEESTAPAEIFAPDPTGAVPAYDALMKDLNSFPLTFSYDGKAYRGFAGFSVASQTSSEVENGIMTEVELRHGDIPLTFRLVGCVYPAERAYEYVVYLTNDGDTDSAVVADLQFDLTFTGKAPVLSGIAGDAGGTYTPYAINLTRQRRVNKGSESGRPTHGDFPYFNLTMDEDKDGNGSGSFIAIGWPGTWKANFVCNKSGEDCAVSLTAGQSQIATYLAPSETIRTPLMAFVTYEHLSADEQTNTWRHFFIQDVMHKPGGENTPTTVGIGGMSSGKTTAKMQLILSAYEKHGIPLESLWMDAGWYTGAAGESVSWPSTGTLDMDMTRFPDGMATIGAYCKSHNMQFLLWFEPENVRLDKETFLANQPDFKEEWLLDKTLVGTWLEGYLMNLGDGGCRTWIFNKICKVIDTAGVTVYRQDFNNDPASAWRAHDGEGRTGMTENLYVQGYLALWDALLERYPNLIIDSCASGGGRNDLETMRRAVPLHYSDWFDGNNEDYDTKARMTQTLFAWFPYFKNEVYQLSLDKIRMNYAPWCMLKAPSPIAKDMNWDLLKQGYDEYQLVRGYFFSDYYQLTEYSLDKDRWNAWAFYDPETASGYASVYCGEGSSTLTFQLRLKGLEADKTYTVTDLDGLVSVTADGRTLMEQGIPVTVPEKPYCAILLIQPAS